MTAPVTVEVEQAPTVTVQVNAEPAPFNVTVTQPAAVTVAFDGPAGPQGVPGPPMTPYSVSVPAVASFTVSHNLGRKPVGVIFYDLTGQECEVGVTSDSTTLTVTQDNPTAGTVEYL